MPQRNVRSSSPRVVAVLYEAAWGVIGRFTWMGANSRKIEPDVVGILGGHWEGARCVESAVSTIGLGSIEQATLILRTARNERFRRADSDTCSFRSPTTIRDVDQASELLAGRELRADTDMLENVCKRNGPQEVHMWALRTRCATEASGTCKYAGRYEFREGSAVVRSFMV